MWEMRSTAEAGMRGLRFAAAEWLSRRSGETGSGETGSKGDREKGARIKGRPELLRQRIRVSRFD
jgi:hypothetical protein